MKHEKDKEPRAYALLMPFLPVQSKGGPFDDEAYVCGYEMGVLDATMSAWVALRPKEQRSANPTLVHKQNREQADLIAMRHGLIAEFAETESDWLELTVRRGQP